MRNKLLYIWKKKQKELNKQYRVGEQSLKQINIYIFDQKDLTSERINP